MFAAAPQVRLNSPEDKAGRVSPSALTCPNQPDVKSREVGFEDYGVHRFAIKLSTVQAKLWGQGGAVLVFGAVKQELDQGKLTP